jgi:hypothetical protein
MLAVLSEPFQTARIYWPFFGQLSFSTLAEVVDGPIAQFPSSRSPVLQGGIGSFGRLDC